MLRRLLLCLLLTAAPVAADEVHLANGDRITGTVTSLAGGTLHVSTPHGNLQIPWVDVRALTVTDAILVTRPGQPAAPATIGPADGPGRVLLTPGGPVELTTIAALARPEPAITVEGGANAGFVQTAGNTDINTLRLDGEVALRQRANRYTASAAVNQADDRNIETARNWNTAVNYDRFILDGLFLNANAIFTQDRFRDLDLRSALGVGIGYQVFDTPLARLTANGGLGWVNENFEDGVDDSYTAARESAALDVFVLPDRVSLFHQHDGYFGVSGEDNLFFRMKNGARFALVGNLVTTLTHDLDYDRSPSPGRTNTDRTFALTFGYRF